MHIIRNDVVSVITRARAAQQGQVQTISVALRNVRVALRHVIACVTSDISSHFGEFLR